MEGRSYSQMLFVSICLRIAISFAPYSGFFNEHPPEGQYQWGDFECHRSWLAQTYYKPLSEWYKDTEFSSRNYWPLDYPPACAYLHRAIASFVVFVLGETPLITKGYQDWTYVVLMRAVIIVLDLVFYQSVIKMMQPQFKTKWMMFLAMNVPTMVIIDHGHFQPNCVVHGLVLWAVYFATKQKLVPATVLMVVAVLFKQMALYYALPFAVYALAQLYEKQNCIYFITRVILLAFVFLGTACLILFPFDPQDLLTRIFPLRRGIFEDYVSTVWCLLHHSFYKVNTKLGQETQFMLTTVVTLVACIPSLVLLWLKPTQRQFKLALLANSMAFYLCSMQVHEKQIITAMVALAITSEDWATHVVAMQSMVMLVHIDQAMWIFAIYMFWIFVVLSTRIHHLPLLNLDKKEHRKQLRAIGMAQFMIGAAFLWDITVRWIESYFGGMPKKLPYLHYLVNVALCFLVFAWVYLRTHWQMYSHLNNLYDKLGQTKYIFADKTGTLTCNVMELVKYSTLTEVFDMQTQQADMLKTDDHKEVLLHLAMCHTVIIDSKSGKFNSSSPDELALVQGAAKMGYIFESRDSENYIKVKGQDKYQLLNVLEFTSTRKRMSVILRHVQSGQICLYTRGADSTIAKLLKKGQDQKLQSCMKFVNEFAASSLRTLLLTKRNLTDDEYSKWNAEWQAALTATQNREALIAEVNAKIEQELTLIGSTAIEDKLQEGVPESIKAIKKAGVNLWVLTGDKIESTINIGFSAGILDISMVIEIFKDNNPRTIKKQLIYADQQLNSKEVKDSGASKAIVIAGDAFSSVQADQLLQDQFLRLTDSVSVVLACRVSPSQKADIVRMVKSRFPSKLTLSIGDGANDVTMIRQADVGVGIAGNESMQAARCSHFTINQFRDLIPLMFDQGKESQNSQKKLDTQTKAKTSKKLHSKME